MKILKLYAENVKRLSVVEIAPDGNLVQITGRNANGKSSVLDAIWWALAGGDNIQSRPIRDGEAEAVIKLDLGEIKITRKFRRKDDKSQPFTTSLIVEGADGSRFPSPQRMLDDMIGALSFDPLEFTRMDAKKQFDALKVFVPDFNFDAFEGQNKTDYEKRTDENRKAKDLRAQAAGITAPDDPVERVDEAALVDLLQQAGEKNAEIVRRQGNRNQVAKDIDAKRANVARHKERLASLTAEIDRLKGEIETTEAEADTLAKKLESAPPLPDQIDTAELMERIAKARTSNDAAAAYEHKAELLKRAKSHEDAAEALTQAMKARVEHKQAAIAKADMPVPGLTLGENEVLLNGRPFDQASDAEKLKTSIAVAIAANPKIRVVRVRDGSLLDDENMKVVADMADKADCQVWVESVRSDGKVGIVMVDGRVETINPAAKIAAE